MKTVEETLLEAGWEEVNVRQVRKGDEVYDPSTGEADTVCSDAPSWLAGKVLRAPRPEPEYEHGTVARIRDSLGNEENATYGTFDTWAAGNRTFPGKDVEVLRVFAHPDGSAPTDQGEAGNVTRIEVIDETGRAYVNTGARDVEVASQDDGRTLKVFTGGIGYTPSYPAADSSVDALIEGMVPRVARAFQRGDHCRNCDWESEDEKWRAMYERVARRTIREAYEEATR